MDVNQIYFNSPDWIKAILVLAPFVTAYAIARLALRRDRGPIPVPPAPPRLPLGDGINADPWMRQRDEPYIRFLEERVEALSAPALPGIEAVSPVPDDARPDGVPRERD